MSNNPVALTPDRGRTAWKVFIFKVIMLIAGSMLVMSSAFAQRKLDILQRDQRKEDLRKERERAEERSRHDRREEREHGKASIRPSRITPDHLTRSFGSHVVRGEQNFTTVANYEKLHPPRVRRMEIENEEIGESEMEPVHGLPDPAMVRERPVNAAYGPMGGGFTPPSMPVSSSPATLFQSTADNNSSIPPDTHGAVDATYCVTAVNGTFHIQTRAGANVSSATLDAFWAPVLSSGGSFDPRVHYDPYADRWIIITVSGSFSAGSSVLVAVSKTGNPTGAWWQYKFDADGTDVDWVDYPVVGFNGKWITVTGNMFASSGGSYHGAKVWVFNKTAAMAGSLSTYTLFSQASSFTLCPTITYSSTLGSMFMVENYNYSVGAMRLWKITGAVGAETMTSVAFPQKSGSPWWYSANAFSGSTSADFAPQSGTTSKVQANDHRVNQMVYMNGKLWFSHTVFLPYSASANPTRASVQWWQIDTTGTPIQFGRVDDPTNTNHYTFPCLAVNTNNDALIGFSAFSSTTHPSAAYAFRMSTDATDSIRTPYIYRAGQNTYYKDYGGGKNRWGDYSATALDPTNNTSFWTLQEASGTTVNSWDTWWAQVNMAGCSVAAITGTMSVCAGSTTTLADATSGGTWSSGATGIATVASTTGVVTGVAAGNATITYTVGSCTVTAVVTVNALPATIGGTASVCTGSTTTLTDGTTGGIWSSSNTGVATIGATTGVVSGIAAGTATITYTTSAGCITTRIVSVNTTPAAIGGATAVCAGSTITLTNSTTGGTWSSSNTTVATIVSTTGVVTGVAAGTTTISYNMSTGCRSTIIITVNALPAAITGTLSMCTGGSTSLADATSGGVWTSSNSAIASVGASTGVVTGVAAGTATITYTLSTGCLRTAGVTVNSSPSAITGTPAVCVGLTTSLGNTLAGGTWSSGATSIATVNSSTGVVTGVASGVAIITYTTACGAVTQSVTVNPNPSAVTGTLSVCVGLSTTLADVTPGGTWSTASGNISVGAATGVVTGVTAGTAMVTYTIGTGCRVTAVVTVNANPASLTGSTSVCLGGTTTLSSTSTGGAWTSSNAAVATITTGGVVTGVAAGTTTISYTLPTGCRTTAVVTVGAASPITGGGTICVGATTSLSNATSGGTWSSSTLAIATVGSATGVVTGVAAGTSTITYTLSGGCRATTVVTVITTPSSITGSTSVCIGATATLANTSAGGVWSSSNTAVATVGASSGVVSGVATGTTTIVYTLGSGCTASVVVTVSSTSTTITVSPTSTDICLGSSSIFSATSQIVNQDFNSGMTGSLGGTWSITNLAGTSASFWQIWSSPGYAGVYGDGSQMMEASPDATGSGVNTNTILTSPTFSLAGYPSATLTFNQYLVSYSPYDNIVAVEYSTDGGSSWNTLSNQIYALIGTTTWSAATPTTTLSLPPDALASSNVQLRWNYNSTWGFYWAVDNIIVSVPGSYTWSGIAGAGGLSCTSCATNTITPTAAGTNVYSVTAGSSGCSASTTVTVNVTPSPAAIGGTASVCTGQSTTLTDATSGGSWFSSDAAASVDAGTGVVTGVSAGTATITYMLPAGCFTTKVVTVNASPEAISGEAAVCVGATTTFSNAVLGGTWSSSATAVATIGATSGVVTGVATGVATMTYTLGGGCRAMMSITVNPLPAAITGTASVCEGGATTLSSTTPGGEWSSSDGSIATVGTSGIVTGMSAGIATITYALYPSFCYRTMNVTVNAAPSAIAGTTILCAGSTTSFSNSVSGGTWASSNITVATIGSATGVVTAVAAGTSTISYTLPGNCRATVVVTVNTTPAAIGGSTSVCVGATTTLTDVTTGGVWSSANTAVATIGSSTGVVTGVANGSVTITYMLGTGCFRTVTMMVNSALSAITGTMTVCAGSTTSLSNATSGGTWSSSATAIATVGSTTGVVTGVAAGMATITYTATSGCKATAVITVSPLPAAITGTTGVCVGATSTLSSTSAGGAWSSANATVATVGSSNGVVSGVAAGTTTITYVLPTGCFRTVTVTVSPAPEAIEGVTVLCAGSTTTLSDATPGGTWSSSVTGVATIGSSTGIVTGITAGTSNISYTAGGCRAVVMVSVNPLPSAITGTMTVCEGGSTTLTSTPTGGEWASSDGFIATVGSTGIVTGMSAGTATISYILYPSFCYRTATVTVTAAPAAIVGASSSCAGTTVTLSDATAGGTWSSSATAIATVGSTTGIVSAIAAGVATISYRVGTCSATLSFTVNAIPAAITGTTTICTGTSSTLSSTTTGGTWSSSDNTVASVGTGGVVNGVSNGTATITYMTGTGCYRTATVTVNVAPTAISGSTFVCVGSTTSLANAVTGGVWTSSTPTIASANSATGVVTGVVAGTATITYSIGTCRATQVVTVGAVPANITGTLSVCVGSSTTLADATGGGIWMSSNSDIAAVGTGGVVTGFNAGNAVITYMLPTGCYKTAAVTVNALPADIDGTLTVCVGATTSLTNTSTPATSWVSSTTAVATITTSGVVTGVTAGTSTITYTQSTGCKTTAVVTVNPLPATIGGTLKVCIGQTTVLTNTTTGGTWTTANASIATVGVTDGTVLGVAAGTTTVTYTLGTGCVRTAVVTVNALPAAITGPASICVGSTATLNNAVTGTWISSDVSVATIGSTTKIITGIAPGTTTITFTANATGCYTTTTETVNPLPAAIGGVSTLCMANTITLTNTSTGGTWASGNLSRATVGSTDGIVTGIATGTVTITYTLSTGCFATAVVTVTAFQPITGTMSACVGMTTTLADATTGGTWSSSDVSVATVGSSNGVVTGVTPGSVNITYTLSSGCFRVASVIINTPPPAISGTLSLCAGSTTSLSNSVAGGTWSSSSTAIATVGVSTGVVTGVAAGTATITYLAGAGCRATSVVTVLALPATIGGATTVCMGATATLTDATSGGSWSSSDPTVASISASGVVTGVSTGSATITYMLGTGCYRTTNISVNPAPGAIDGSSVVCAGSITTLANPVSGGVWSSSNAAVATVGSSSGVVTGVAAGTSNIIYTVGGCTATMTLTVNALPAAITGALALCQGGTTTLSSTTPSGTWSGSNDLVATVNATTGVVTGVSTGTVIVSYTAGSGCSTSAVATVYAVPAITGGSPVCVGSSSLLSGTPGGGTWSSSNSAILTVGSASGLITGVASGVANITYTVAPAGCYATTSISVNPVPGAITGTASVFPGSTTTLSSTTTGGAWSSSNTSVATVGSANGVVTGVSVGVASITYMLGTGCFATIEVTVSGTAAITGTLSVCEGATTVLSNPVSGGTWTSGNTGVATINTSGVVSGISAGTSVITYAFPGGGSAMATVTVNPLPAPISGSFMLCAGSSTTLTDATAGGTWSSNTTAVATIGATSGIVNANASGTTLITYMLSTGCIAIAPLTVNPQPAAITGATTTLVGSTTTLSNATAGGIWISADPSVASVDGSGVVTGVSTGSTTITYMLSTGCFRTATITVNAALTPIVGAGAVCVGSEITLSNATAGGTWSSSNASIATIDGSGIVTGIAPGTTTITYTISAGAYTTAIVSVNSVPAAISGITSFCAGTTSALSNATSGGIWSSGNTAVATVDASGVVTGVSGGTALISYTLSTGCYATAVVIIGNAPGTITGAGTVCPGTTLTLHSVGGGGNWSSADASIATVGSTSGVVTGVSAGMVAISYTLPTGCYASVIITVNSSPAAIAGSTSACIGATATLTNTSTGGAWTSSNAGVATVDPATGVYTGVSSGTATITYAIGSGCFATQVVTVMSLPATITGTKAVCVGGTTNLSSTTSGGAWSSSDNSVATVGISGTVTGVATGTATITYSIGSGCYVTAEVTVNPQPSAITGSTSVCVGSATTLSSTPAGGTWSATSPGVVSVAPTTGIVTGLGGGTANVTYTIATGCKTTTIVTVGALPGSISGTTKTCPGTSTTLTDGTPGGTWSSSDITVATVGSSDGIVTGVTAGTVTISYTTGASCYRTTTVTINAAPVISGASAVCIGSTTGLTATPIGGTWASSDPTIASINSGGTVSGAAAGNVFITYTAPSSGCVASLAFTVSALPSAIGGTLKTCVGATTTLTDVVPGGTWSSSNTAIATVGSSTGVVTGIGAATARITYTAPGGCYIVGVVTVNAAASPITGSPMACVGTTTTLSGPSGVWSSSDLSIATVGSSNRIVTGVAPGTATITVTISTGCFSTTTVTINPVPPAIGGTTTLCAGQSTTLTNTQAGGTWSSANTAVATIGSLNGVVNAVAQGTITISYNFGSGCRTTASFTVRPLPAVIVGSSYVCVGSTMTLSDVTSGGTWSSSDVTVATVGTGISAGYGAVAGVAAGTVDISYTLTATGCARTKTVTVNTAPDAGTLSGPTTVIIANTITLASTVTGGTWVSGSASVATVGSSTGIVTGVSAGAAEITYTVNNGCGNASAVYTVNVTTSRPGNPATEQAPGVVVTDVTIFPNPTTGKFSINASEAGVISIFSVEGKQVQKYNVTAGITELSLPEGLAAGIYMARFNGNSGGTVMIRLIFEQ